MDSNIVNLNDLFFDDNYSLENLLAKTQESRLNLAELRNQLLQHQQDLNQSSLELFNNSYDRFYKLSYLIACLAEPIQRLIDPLQQFRDQLGQVVQNHEHYVQDISNKLSALEGTSKNKGLTKRLIVLIKRYNRLEKQVENIDWSVRAVNLRDFNGNTTTSMSTSKEKEQEIKYKIKCDLLERVNVELYHLTIEVCAIQPTHDELRVIKESLESSLKKRQYQLDNWFEGAFLEAIELQDKALIDLIVRTYKQKNSLHKLDLVWRNKVIKPYLNLVLTEAQLPHQYSQVYELLDQFIKRQLELVQAEFVIKSFWSEVVDSLDQLDSFYSLANLDSFQSRFNETRSFLAKQELHNMMITGDVVRHNTYKIMKKFNLKGYFHHRMSQIASSVESSLANQPLCEISTTSGQQLVGADGQENLSQFRLKICMHIYALVTKCWSPELYIDSLESSFCQLACRIINRFADWLSKLRLSDFRITGPAAPENHRQTNFLAKQDAIMRLLIEDCNKLTDLVNTFLATLDNDTNNKRPVQQIRRELITESFNEFQNGLNNVRSLQRLIER